MSSSRFQNALELKAQNVPPIWFMRQAGRYHRHYQRLRERHGFMELCKEPELAAEVALGPVADFDFDVAILFSDLLFPLEALGMGLVYDPGPKLDRALTAEELPRLRPVDEAVQYLQFQKAAVQLTRERLPKNKSLIGFVGGPWTLFTYAVGAGHHGDLINAKTQFSLFRDFSRVLIELLKRNIQLQLDGGAEIVMVFDTAAGELSPHDFNRLCVPGIREIADQFKRRIGYYSRQTQRAHVGPLFSHKNLAGVGVDHRWELADVLKSERSGFVQGNFDQALLFLEPADLEREIDQWLAPIRDLPFADRAGWVCGLGHGVLPKTPEENVRRFITRVRELCAK